ncbi:MAG TPA: hypothetical protein VMI54_20955 [Polyangiaceae bacterium]|nr:hypothetical protein [Polyangiaceae bacterium]
MRTLAPSTLLACLALTRFALAQSPPVAPTAPPAASATPPAETTPRPAPTTSGAEEPAPPAQPTPPTGGPQPTPDVPVQTEPSPPTPLEPAPGTPVPGAIQTPDATAPTPAAMLGVNVPGDKASARTEAPTKDAWQDGHALGVDVMARGGSRVGAPSFAADTQEKAGLGFALGAAFRLVPAFSFGFGLDRMSLGSASATSGQSTVNAHYAMTELELGARAYPLRWDEAELFVGLHVGLAWQDVDASGLRQSANLDPAQVFRCSDTAGPGFALGAELGGALRLARSFWFVGNVAADGYQLSSDPIGTCAVGIGSITALSVGAGLLYAFDLGREAQLSATRSRSAF